MNLTVNRVLKAVKRIIRLFVCRKRFLAISMLVEITNSQKLKKINLPKLENYLNRIGNILDISSQKISLFFCDRNTIKKINKRFFGKSQSTDVISFPLKDDFDVNYLGEIVVSVEEAVKTCNQFGLSWQKELLLYVIHGILHLLGYDDRTAKKRMKMEKKQQEVLEKLF